ncbi:MAG: cytochrome P450 [Candidatus Binatia bacterium]
MATAAARPGTIHYDPFASEVIADPYPFYARLLADDAVHRDERNDLWVLSKHEDVSAALRDHRALSSAEGVGYQRMGVPMMLTLDPPDHTRLRRIVSREFTPRNLERWRPVVDRLAREAVGRLVDSGTADFVETVAAPLPVAVIAGMLELPAADLPDLRRISDDAVEGFKMTIPQNRFARGLASLLSNRAVVDFFTRLGMRFPTPTTAVLGFLTGMVRRAEGETPFSEDIARGIRAVSDLQRYCGGLVRERRRRPGEDLVSMLIAQHPDGSLTEPEVFWFFFLLLLAGHETTTNLLGNLVLALMANPGEWALLRENRGLVPSAVNEALRFEAPIQGFFRTAREPYGVRDVEIPVGARVLLLFGAANRDPRRYPDPDRFLVRRNPTDHLGFGGGIHYCLGAALAEMEGSAVLSELLSRVSRLELAGEVRRTMNPTLRGVKRLPLRFSAS